MAQGAERIFRFAGDVDAVRELARRRLPRGLFEFIDRGSDDELAILNNRTALDRIKFRPRVLTDVSGRSAQATVLGRPAAMPLAIAPTGSAGIVWFQGELELARAAAAAGIPFTLANRSMTAIETIAAEAGGDVWFQIYPLRDRALTYELVARAAAAGARGLVVTVDTPLSPSRDYNERNGFSLPFRSTARGVVDILRHPRWLAGVVGRYHRHGGLPRFENLPERRRISGGMTAAAMLCDDLTWADIDEFRRRWPGKLIVKGLLHPEDARRAVACGADAVVVSNHGARNLDGTLAPIDALPDIVAAVGQRAEVFMDGGVRRGADIAKAVALGANCVLVGRAAVAGQSGAAHVLGILQRELLYTLATLGCRSLADLGPDILHAPHLALPRASSDPADL